MNDGDALLRAILAHPDEDTPRLMYADWLDENGQPERAEFIRLQILLHNTPFIRKGGYFAVWPEPWASRIARVNRLVAAHGAEWAGPARALAPRLPEHMFGRWFERGFVEHIPLYWDALLAHTGAIFAACPVRTVWDVGTPRRQEPVDMTTRHVWFGGGVQPFDSSRLPTAIYDLLPIEWRERGWRYESDARLALSDAIVRYGRRRVGLPDLPPSPLLELPAAA